MQFADDFALRTFSGGSGLTYTIKVISADENKEYGLLKLVGGELTFLKKVNYPEDYFKLPKNVENYGSVK